MWIRVSNPLNQIQRYAPEIERTLNVLASLIAIVGVFGGQRIWIWLSQKPIGLTLFGFFCGLAVAILVRLGLKIFMPSLRWIPRGYRVDNAEYLFEILDENLLRHLQRTTINLTAMEPGVDLFEVGYFWSGLGTETLPRFSNSRHRIQGEPIPEGVWKKIYVYLGDNLSIGQKETLVFEQEFNDIHHTFQPRLTKQVLDPMKKLVLRVKFPSGREPKNLRFQKRTNSLPTGIVYYDEAGKFDKDSKEVIWEISRPIIVHVYGIYWEWDAPINKFAAPLLTINPSGIPNN